MNNQEKETILILKISKQLKEDLDALVKRYNTTIEDLLIPVLRDYVISKNTKPLTSEELDKIIAGLDEIFEDTKVKPKPKNLTYEEIEELLKNDSFWKD